MNRAADVDLVIPTWNGRDLLMRCLHTIAGQTVQPNVVVVDNGSEDGTADAVRERFPEVHIIGLERNRGFAAAVNRGIESGRAPYIVLVNNDVECDRGFVERIVAPLRQSQAIGMVAALLLRPGRETIDSYGLEFDDTLSVFARFRGAPYSGPGELHEQFLAGPSGGAAAYARKALDEAGRFDEGMFAYMEDADLALRLHGAGWLCAGAPNAVGVHLGSATIGRRSGAQVEIAGASRGYMLRKYRVLKRGPLTAAWALGIEAGVVAVESILHRDLRALRGRMRGWRGALGAQGDVPSNVVNPHIGPREALRRRYADAALR